MESELPNTSIMSELFDSADPAARIAAFYSVYNPSEVLCTCSFGSTSLLLLNLIAKIQPDQAIHFIDTRNHFPETLAYRDELAQKLNLNIQSLSASEEVHDYTRDCELWKTDRDYCCYLKKVEPLNVLKSRYSVWITGLMRWQNANRSDIGLLEFRNGILKFNPLYDVTKADCEERIRQSNLPVHPLLTEGFESIGCIHCTEKGEGREGRWKGSEKTECGIHV